VLLVPSIFRDVKLWTQSPALLSLHASIALSRACRGSVWVSVRPGSGCALVLRWLRFPSSGSCGETRNGPEWASKAFVVQATEGSNPSVTADQGGNPHGVPALRSFRAGFRPASAGRRKTSAIA
jgi:hypothetical protein